MKRILLHIKITLPALFINAMTLSHTSFAMYFGLGNLYSGSSEIYELLVCLNFVLESTNAKQIIIIFWRFS